MRKNIKSRRRISRNRQGRSVSAPRLKGTQLQEIANRIGYPPHAFAKLVGAEESAYFRFQISTEELPDWLCERVWQVQQFYKFVQENKRKRGQRKGPLPETQDRIRSAGHFLRQGLSERKMALHLYPRSSTAYESTRALFSKYRSEINAEKKKIARRKQSPD